MSSILDSIKKELDAFSFTLISFSILPVFDKGIKLKTNLSLKVSYKGTDIGYLNLTLIDGKVDYSVKAGSPSTNSIEVLNFLSTKYRYSLDSFSFFPLMVSFSVKDLEIGMIVGFLTVTYDRGLKFQFERVI